MTPPAAAIYCRVSSDGQRDRHTIGSQMEALPAMAGRLGLSVVRTYVDDGVSAAALRKMPGLNAVLDDAESGRFSRLLVVSIDRLTRFELDGDRAVVLDILRKSGVRIVTLDREYDLDNPGDRLGFGIMDTVSLYERQVIRDRCRRGQLHKRKQGQWMGGTPPTPYVYDRAAAALVVDPAKLAAVRAILDLSIGHAPRDIARQVPGHTPRMIRRILEDERLLFYAGKTTVDGDVIDGAWPAILTDHERLAIVNGKRRRNARGADRSTAANHLLTGLGVLRCGYCSRSLKAWTDKKIRKSGKRYQRTYYRCTSIHDVTGPCDKSRMIPAGRLEEKVLAAARRVLSDIGLIKAGIAAQAAADDAAARIAALRPQLEDARSRRARIVAAIESDVIDLSDARRRMDAIRDDIAAIEQQLSEAQAAPRPYDLDTLQTLAETDPANLPFHDARTYITTCYQTISVHHHNAYLHFNFPITETGQTTKRLKL